MDRSVFLPTIHWTNLTNHANTRTMEYLPYLLAPLSIVAMLVYMVMMKKRNSQAVAEGRAGELFHDVYAQNFTSLTPRERILCVWQGVAYTGSTAGGAHAAGAVANALASNLVGVSTYTPNVIVALMTSGRLMVIEEYSELGSRGNYREAVVWGPFARAVTGPTAIADHQGAPPANPFNPAERLELALLISPDGASSYRAWLSGTGLGGNAQLAQPISRVIPIQPEVAAQMWAQANPGAPLN